MGGAGPVHTRFGLPSPSRAVKLLLIANLSMFVLQALAGDFREGSLGPMTAWLAVTPAKWWELWRYVTFQFLHGGVWHLFLNMLALYMLGTPLEGHYGSRRFISFYLLCGAVAGLLYVVVELLLIGPQATSPLVGASGGVFGIILAAAVYFPNFRILFLFFPVPIRVAAVLIFAVMGLTILVTLGGVLRGDTPQGEFWSHVAHFGGAVAAAVWIVRERRGGLRLWKARAPAEGRWKKNMQQRTKTQHEVDRILEKIHVKGIASLTGREKRTLKKATNQQKTEDQRISRL